MTSTISLQRQCDGIYADIGETPRCDAVLVMAVTLNVLLDDEQRWHFLPKAIDAWERAGTALGWFRQHGVGHHETVNQGACLDITLVIPSTRVWVSCPACSEKMKLGCARYHSSSCACLGGPRGMDAIEVDES